MSKPRMTRWLREAVSMVEDEGLKVSSIRPTGSTHFQLTCDFPLGGSKKFVISSTPSEGRGKLNFAALIRREKRARSETLH